MANVPNHGVTISLSDMAATPVFAAIGQVVAVTPPNPSRGSVPVPDHDSTGGIPYFPNALYEPGEVTVTVKHDPALATHDPTTGLREAMNDGVIRDFRVVLPDTGATQHDFQAIVQNWNPSPMPVSEGIKMLDIVLKVSGTITES